MAIRYNVGLSRAQRTRKAGRAAQQTALRALREATAWGVRHMSMKKLVPVDTGSLAGSMRTRVRVAGQNVVIGRIFSPLKYAAAVERGRRPGRRRPPVAAIEAWARRKKLTAYGGRGIALYRLARRIARSIAKKGTKGAFFFKKTAAALRPRMREFFRRAGRGI